MNEVSCSCAFLRTDTPCCNVGAVELTHISQACVQSYMKALVIAVIDWLVKSVLLAPKTLMLVQDTAEPNTEISKGAAICPKTVASKRK